jgi:membrane-associated phospholipid phosphatase
MGLGALFGGARILMGAHFLSDVLYAAVLMLLVANLLHRAMFGWKGKSLTGS